MKIIECKTQRENEQEESGENKKEKKNKILVQTKVSVWMTPDKPFPFYHMKNSFQSGKIKQRRNLENRTANLRE